MRNVRENLEPNDHKKYHHCSLVTPVSTDVKIENVPLPVNKDTIHVEINGDIRITIRFTSKCISEQHTNALIKSLFGIGYFVIRGFCSSVGSGRDA